MIELSKKVGDMNYDGLITDLVPPVQVRGGIIAKLATAETYSRGTILAKSADDGKLYVLGSSEGGELTPDCILCDETEIGTAEDVNVTAYTAGCFDPEKTQVKSGYIITEADKDELRMRGIVFKAAFEAN